MPRKEPAPETHAPHRTPGPTYTRQPGELTGEKQEILAAGELADKLGAAPEEDTSLTLNTVEPKKR